MTADRISPTLAQFSLYKKAPNAELIAALYLVSQDADLRFSEHGFGHLLLKNDQSNQIPDDFSEIFHHGDIFVLHQNDTNLIAGFAVAAECDSLYWLRQMSVLRQFGGLGLGKILLSAIVSHAKIEKFGAIGLTTFKTIPFNAPFYAKHGFKVADPTTFSKSIQAQFESEIPNSVAPNQRCLMIKQL